MSFKQAAGRGGRCMATPPARDLRAVTSLRGQTMSPSAAASDARHRPAAAAAAATAASALM